MIFLTITNPETKFRQLSTRSRSCRDEHTYGSMAHKITHKTNQLALWLAVSQEQCYPLDPLIRKHFKEAGDVVPPHPASSWQSGKMSLCMEPCFRHHFHVFLGVLKDEKSSRRVSKWVEVWATVQSNFNLLFFMKALSSEWVNVNVHMGRLCYAVAGRYPAVSSSIFVREKGNEFD